MKSCIRKAYTMKNKKRTSLAFWFLLLSIALFMLLFVVRESDYFWHIKAGEYMFKNGILKKDVFSWFVQGKYWFSHEWLFEVILYSLKLIFGKFHILVYVFSCFLMLLVIIFCGNKKEMLKNIPFSLLWLSFFLILIIYAQARPHLLSFCFLALTIYLLFDLYKNEDSKKVYLLPVFTILWANIHGGSSNLSYIFCLLFIIGGIFNFNFSKMEAKRISKKQLKKYFLVMLLCIVSICLNIHSIKMLSYPYTNLSNTVMLNNIAEWQPTTLTNLAHLPYFLFCFIIVLIFLISEKKIAFIDFLLFISVLFLGLKSVRFWGYTYIVMSFVVFKYVKKRKYDNYSNLVIFLVGLLFMGIFFANEKMAFKGIKTKDLNKEIISIIKEEKPQKLFNMYNYGGELIYNGIKVFIDGRADLYSEYNYEDYLNISKLEKDYVKLIDKYDFDYFLVDNTYPIYTYLKYDKKYECIYNKKKISIYKKRTSS